MTINQNSEDKPDSLLSPAAAMPESIISAKEMDEAVAPPVASDKKTRRSIKRYVIYFFALLGALALGLVAFAIYQGSKIAVKAQIDDAQTIDVVMTRNYGKYSEQHKGWLYVGEGNRTYVMRVVQQAKPEDVQTGDQLYFVASGTPLDGNAGALYGVFQVRLEEGSKDGTTVEISSPFRYEGDVAVTPERVKFEALSTHVWAWVIKVQEGADKKDWPVSVRNVVLSPRDGDIVQLASFNASFEYDPGVPCEEANRLYAEYNNPTSKIAPAKSENANVDKNKPDQEKVETEETEAEYDQPVRCNDAKWTYRTDPISGQAFTPITVTRKGVLDGQKLADKTWKLIFDSKSYVYILPDELAVR